MANLRKKGIAFVKIVISLALVYFIFTKVDLAEVATLLRKTNPFYLIGAFLLFILSKIIAAIRLNLYFHQVSVKLTQLSNLKLYALGMFYNLFLPGGIGGDAYKGYLIKKKFGVPTKKALSVLVLDRLSGLLLLFIYACILAILIGAESLKVPTFVILLLICLSILFFWIINKKFFSNTFQVFWKSFGLSALVQLAQLGSAWCILAALNLEADAIAYLFIFLLSSIASVLPITIGGVGSREITFYYGSSWLHVDQDASIGISMIFFFITAIVSLWGIGYHFKKPTLDVEKQSYND
ncbi:lysylphosphatidylglycerol synthase transmembrane domain-containing protein [Pareuzebyella sediminis]|uniref:lysylphosphatidylglycerol synthase transmembrane domain-containing protein n=1 Tax=Pareuzebyella sediminis TaxID=2607998 RepID=UPI001E61CEA0|nr:lysylphosphatidylglycerol synthase transmembrane domain-containing protein [Pareuzebyella sediminis]